MSENAVEQSWNCRISMERDILTVVTPGGKTCAIYLPAARKVGMTLDELDLTRRLVNGLSEEDGTSQEVVTLSEMHMLAALRTRITESNGKATAPEKTSIADGIAAKRTPTPPTEGEKTKTETNTATRHFVDSRAPIYSGTAEGKTADLQQRVALAQEQMWMLTYDIPDRKKKECPNPSRDLWQFGCRFNLSVWVMPQRGLDSKKVQEYLAHWREHKLKIRLVRYHPDDMRVIREEVANELADHVRELHTSLISNIASASDRLAAAQKKLIDSFESSPTKKELSALESLKDNQVRAMLKAAAGDLEKAIQCARLFDEYEKVEDLLQGLRDAIRSEQQSFNAEMRQKGAKPSTVRV